MDGLFTVRWARTWLYVLLPVRREVPRLHRCFMARPRHETFAAPVELDAFLGKLHQPSQLSATRAETHATRHVQELIRRERALPPKRLGSPAAWRAIT